MDPLESESRIGSYGKRSGWNRSIKQGGKEMVSREIWGRTATSEAHLWVCTKT